MPILDGYLKLVGTGGGGGGGGGSSTILDVFSDPRHGANSLRMLRTDWDEEYQIAAEARQLNQQASFAVTGSDGRLTVTAEETWRRGTAGNGEQIAFRDRRVPVAHNPASVLLPSSGGTVNPGVRVVIPRNLIDGDGDPVTGLSGASGDDWSVAVDTANAPSPGTPATTNILSGVITMSISRVGHEADFNTWTVGHGSSALGNAVQLVTANSRIAVNVTQGDTWANAIADLNAHSVSVANGFTFALSTTTTVTGTDIISSYAASVTAVGSGGALGVNGDPTPDSPRTDPSVTLDGATSGASLKFAIAAGMSSNAADVNDNWRFETYRRQHAIAGVTAIPASATLMNGRLVFTSGTGAEDNGRTVRTNRTAGASDVGWAPGTGDHGAYTLSIQTGATWSQVLTDLRASAFSTSQGLTFALGSGTGESDTVAGTDIDASNTAVALAGGVNGTTGTAQQSIVVEEGTTLQGHTAIFLGVASDHTLQQVHDALVGANLYSYTVLDADVTITGDATSVLAITEYPLNIDNGVTRQQHRFTGGIDAAPYVPPGITLDLPSKRWTVVQAHDSEPDDVVAQFRALPNFGSNHNDNGYVTTEGTSPAGLLTEGTYDFANGRDAVWAHPRELVTSSAEATIWAVDRENITGYHFRIQDHADWQRLVGIDPPLGVAGNDWSIEIVHTTSGRTTEVDAAAKRFTATVGEASSIAYALNDLSQAGTLSDFGNLFEVTIIGGTVERSSQRIAEQIVNFSGGSTAEAIAYINSADTVAQVDVMFDADARFVGTVGAASGSQTFFAAATAAVKTFAGGIDEEPIELLLNTSAKTGIMRYHTSVDTLGDIAGAPTVRGGGAMLWYRGTAAAGDTPEAVGWSRNVGPDTLPGAGGTVNITGLTIPQVDARVSETFVEAAVVGSGASRQVQLTRYDGQNPRVLDLPDTGGGGSGTGGLSVGKAATAGELNTARTGTGFDVVGITADISSGITLTVRDLDGNGLSSLGSGDVLVWDANDAAYERVVDASEFGTAGTSTNNRIWFTSSTSFLNSAADLDNISPLTALLTDETGSNPHPSAITVGDVVINTGTGHIFYVDVAGVGSFDVRYSGQLTFGSGSNVPDKPATPSSDTEYNLKIASDGTASWAEDTGGGTSGADTDLQNIDTDLTATERATVRTRIGASVAEGEQAVSNTAWTSRTTYNKSDLAGTGSLNDTRSIAAPPNTEVEKFEGAIEVDVSSFSGFEPHGRFRAEFAGGTNSKWHGLDLEGDDKTFFSFDASAAFTIRIQMATPGSQFTVRHRLTDQKWTEKGDLHDSAQALARQEATRVLGDLPSEVAGKSSVEANPSDAATAGTLAKLDVDGAVYDVPGTVGAKGDKGDPGAAGSIAIYPISYERNDPSDGTIMSLGNGNSRQWNGAPLAAGKITEAFINLGYDTADAAGSTTPTTIRVWKNDSNVVANFLCEGRIDFSGEGSQNQFSGKLTLYTGTLASQNGTLTSAVEVTDGVEFAAADTIIVEFHDSGSNLAAPNTAGVTLYIEMATPGLLKSAVLARPSKTYNADLNVLEDAATAFPWPAGVFGTGGMDGAPLGTHLTAGLPLGWSKIHGHDGVIEIATSEPTDSDIADLTYDDSGTDTALDYSIAHIKNISSRSVEIEVAINFAGTGEVSENAPVLQASKVGSGADAVIGWKSADAENRSSSSGAGTDTPEGFLRMSLLLPPGEDWYHVRFFAPAGFLASAGTPQLAYSAIAREVEFG